MPWTAGGGQLSIQIYRDSEKIRSQHEDCFGALYLVAGQQEVIEAGVGSGQSVRGRAIAADDKWRLQGGQPFDGHPVRARHKHEQALLLRFCEAMHRLPEPPNHLQQMPMYWKLFLLLKGHSMTCLCR